MQRLGAIAVTNLNEIRETFKTLHGTTLQKGVRVMSNFIVSYDLNGPRPSHAEMDRHLEKLGVARGRILETVWYVGYSGTQKQLRDHIQTILGKEDLLIVVHANSAAWTKLLVSDEALTSAWNQNR
jgi:hypothetical protein